MSRPRITISISRNPLGVFGVMLAFSEPAFRIRQMLNPLNLARRSGEGGGDPDRRRAAWKPPARPLLRKFPAPVQIVFPATAGASKWFSSNSASGSRTLPATSPASRPGPEHRCSAVSGPQLRSSAALLWGKSDLDRSDVSLADVPHRLLITRRQCFNLVPSEFRSQPVGYPPWCCRTAHS